jgi:hypothetical protein
LELSKRLDRLEQPSILFERLERSNAVERLERLEQALPYVSVAVERFELAQSWVERLELLERLELAFVFMERASFLRYRRINTLCWSDPRGSAFQPRMAGTMICSRISVLYDAMLVVV